MTKITGILPEDILPEGTDSKQINGVNVRKGTVAAVLANIELLEKHTSSIETKQSALKAIKSLVPALIAVGLDKYVTWKNTQVQCLINEATQKLNSQN